MSRTQAPKLVSAVEPVSENLGGSSSGRTTDSDSVNLGSNPSPPAKTKGPGFSGPFSFWLLGLGSEPRDPRFDYIRSDPNLNSEAAIAASMAQLGGAHGCAKSS